jgi:hypothetical protein
VTIAPTNRSRKTAMNEPADAATRRQRWRMADLLDPDVGRRATPSWVVGTVGRTATHRLSATAVMMLGGALSALMEPTLDNIVLFW